MVQCAIILPLINEDRMREMQLHTSEIKIGLCVRGAYLRAAFSISGRLNVLFYSHCRRAAVAAAAAARSPRYQSISHSA